VTAVGGILFASIADAGMINPLLVIAGELARRGVPDLHFASTEDRRADVEAISTDNPVRFVSFGERLERPPGEWNPDLYAAATQPAKPGSLTARPQNVIAYLSGVTDASIMVTMYERALAVVDEVQPALMVIDSSSVYPTDAAIARNIPYVYSVPISVSEVFADRLPLSYPSPNTGLPRSLSPRQKLANLGFRLRLLLGMLTKVPAVQFTKARKEAGILNATAGQSGYADRAQAILAYSVFGMEYPFDAAPSHLRMVGPVVPPLPEAVEPDPSLSAWLDEHESVVYLAFGTHMRLTATQVAAIAEAARRIGPEHHVLWKLPKAQRALLPADLPPNVRLEHWVPSQFDVLAHPHVRVYYNHGGGNSAYEGIYFGKPGLVQPFWMDCHDHAARVLDSGCGLVLSYEETISADAIVAKLRRVLEEKEFTARAEEWADRFRSAGGAGAAADAVLAAASSR
jgi:polyene glycosyltransferase